MTVKLGSEGRIEAHRASAGCPSCQNNRRQVPLSFSFRPLWRAASGWVCECLRCGQCWNHDMEG
jgi:hypothetical protein